MNISSILLLLCSLAITQAAGQPKNSALLRNIKSLTLYKDRQTTHRRVSSIPQVGHRRTLRICFLLSRDSSNALVVVAEGTMRST